MFSALWASRERNKIIALAVGLVAVVGATAYSQVRLNAWNKPFYNALAHKDVPLFLEQLGVFVILALILLALNVAQMWLNQMSMVVLRQGLVEDLLSVWLAPLRAFRLSNAGEIAANPDQRIQQDASHLTELTTNLGIGLLQSTLLLASFVGVLWYLSSGMQFKLAGHTFGPPGYMVWTALIYAGIASLVSWLVGRPLIRLDAERYAREADFRFAIVRVNEEIDGITLYGGEADERRRVQAAFDVVVNVSRQIVFAVTGLTWVTAGYGWFTIVAPILVAAPAYFQSGMSFGELMMVVGAFNQVQTALRWFVDNFSNIADWRATLLRVASFRKTILTMDELGCNIRRIEFEVSEDSSITIDDLRVLAPGLCFKLGEKHVELHPGERVLVCGENGEERALVFRAISGLWPWGHGRISHPPREAMMFMPARPYVPPGDLRSAAAYPQAAETYDSAAVAKAFSAVGLDRLESMLDKTERWDRRLTDDEKQCLAFARVMLQKPQWLVMNDALDELDPASRGRIETLLMNELKNVGIVAIGRAESDQRLFSRKLRLVHDAEGPILKPADMLAGASAAEPAREPASAG
ncbi:MAG TPA: ABC transporter ATP-binding protein/permease [Roseiarcus sp.]|nr:ABC transporter ATP-binding protein/permease [Roseiarcus sp.]